MYTNDLFRTHSLALAWSCPGRLTQPTHLDKAMKLYFRPNIKMARISTVISYL